MSYLIELQTPAGVPGYLITDGGSSEEALASLQEQLEMAEAEEVMVLAVHTVH